MEVDLYPKIDLLDFFRGKVSLRRLVVFATELDNDSLLVKELGRRQHGDSILWDANDHMMALLLNTARDHLFFDVYKAWSNAEEGQRGPEPTPPEPIYPPGYQPPQEEEKKFASAKEIAEFFGQFERG